MKKFIPFIAFVFLCVAFAVAVMTNNRVPESALIGKFAPDGMKGPALVNFFASWCVPCAEEQPVLQSLTPVKIYGIAYKDKPDAVKEWLKKHGNPFTEITHDPQGKKAIEWGVYGVPETFVVDARGIVLYRHVGPLDAKTLNEKIKPLLAGDKK